MCKKNCKLQEIVEEMAKDVERNKKNNDEEVKNLQLYPNFNLLGQEFNPNLSINLSLSLNK